MQFSYIKGRLDSLAYSNDFESIFGDVDSVDADLDAVKGYLFVYCNVSSFSCSLVVVLYLLP